MDIVLYLFAIIHVMAALIIVAVGVRLSRLCVRIKARCERWVTINVQIEKIHPEYSLTEKQ